ncbi:MAG: AsmA family protein [Deltaproteobacteria bacterium]|nr:MAG: AsmA family protein [Deltaproteobacteria bacterium]
MTKRKRRALIWLGSIFGIIAIAAGVFIATLDSNKAKRYVSAGVSKATGRQLIINGDLKVDLGWVSRVRANQIQFANASWSKHPQMVEVGLLDVEIDLWQLLKRRLVLPTVTISEPKVILEKNAEGSANWEFRAAPAVTEPVVPEKRTEFPVIEKLIIKDGTFLFDNQETNAQIDLKLTRAEAEGFLEEPVKLRAEGTYQKQPMTLSLDGGSYQNLRSSEEPYPLRINLGVGELKAKVNGNLTEPLQMKGESVTLDIQGDDMANLFPLIRLVFPSTPPYGLKGRLKHEGDVWSFSNFSGRVGNSDLSGNIHVDTGRERLAMKADLVSNMLDFKDLAGFIGGKPGTNESEKASEEEQKAAAEKENDRLFPDQRYDLERLRVMDADVRLRAKQILAPNLPIDNLDAKLSLNDGTLSFAPAAFGVANGRVEIYSTFEGSKQPPKVNIDARLRQLDLKRFVKSTFAQKTIGPIGGRVALSGTGDSFRALMANASGNIFLMMSGGEISELLTRLAGLNVARALGVLVSGDKPIPIRCALVDVQGTDGQMGVQTLVFDTANSVISGEGKIDLRDEKLDILLTPVPKDFSPFSLRSFIRVNGPLKNISAFPDPIKTGTDSVLAKIFNVFVMLALSPLQPRDLGLAEDVNCDALIARVLEKDPQGVILKDFYNNGGQKNVSENRPSHDEARTGGSEPKQDKDQDQPGKAALNQSAIDDRKE